MSRQEQAPLLSSGQTGSRTYGGTTSGACTMPGARTVNFLLSARHERNRISISTDASALDDDEDEYSDNDDSSEQWGGEYLENKGSVGKCSLSSQMRLTA